MSFVSWMHVNQSLVDPGQQEIVLDGIVTAARRRNEQLDVTGCLIFARTRFAQILDGPADAIAELRQSIRADHRHVGVTPIEVGQIGGRRFSEWSLAYAGPSIFVERITEEMLTKLTTSRAPEPINALLQLMENLTPQHDHIPPILH